MSLDDETKSTNDIGSEHTKLLISGKSLKRELQHRSEDRQKVNDMKYRLDGAVAAERCA